MTTVTEQTLELNRYLSRQIKKYRGIKGWSLSKTADKTGVSKAMLGQIERGESSPTVATLWKIARGFETSFSSFFIEENAQPPQSYFPIDDKMQVKTLFGYQADTAMETFEITLAANHQQRCESHQLGVIEHVIVVKGEMQVLIEEQWQPLKEGECVRFSADQPHGYAANEQPVVFHNIVCYPRK